MEDLKKKIQQQIDDATKILEGTGCAERYDVLLNNVLTYQRYFAYCEELKRELARTVSIHDRNLLRLPEEERSKLGYYLTHLKELLNIDYVLCLLEVCESVSAKENDVAQKYTICDNFCRNVLMNHIKMCEKLPYYLEECNLIETRNSK